VRPVEDVKRDITLFRRYYSQVEAAFLGDADPPRIPTGDLVEILSHLRATFPELKRVTAYARASTLWKKKKEGIDALARAGLNRVHMGLESGDPGVLRFHRKGQTPETVIEAGLWCKEAGIEVSFYVLLGLGGRDRWVEHMDGTAQVINRVNPEFARLRRLWMYRFGGGGGGPECPLWEQVRAGTFHPQTPEGTVRELRRLLEKLEDVSSLVTCDHANNYIRLEGQMPRDRDAMIAAIDRFLALPAEVRERHYASVGSHI
jgi:hypothetical protein